MAPRVRFGTDGIRGCVGEHPIDAEFMLKQGCATGRVLGGGDATRVVIGKDTRISGYMFESALEAGLSAAGVDIHLLGPMLFRGYRTGPDPFIGDGWFPTGDLGRWTADGRLVVDGRRGDVIVTGGEKVWPEPVEAILNCIKSVTEQCKPELVADLADHGIVLTGGGALLRGLDQLMNEQLGIPVRVTDDPLTTVARGTAICLEHLSQWRDSLDSGDGDI